MHRRDKSNSETATHICISLRLSLLYAYVCARKRVCVCARPSASLSACACVSARIGAPVFVCMRVSIHVRSHPPFPLISRLSSRADVEGDVKIVALARSHAYRREEFLKIRGWEAYTEDPPEPCTPSYRPPLSLSLVTSQHRASLPNTIEMPLRQNAHQTGPQPCHSPSYPTETSCFSSPFIPSLSLHLIAALQPPCPSPPFRRFKEIHFVLFSDLSRDSRRRPSTTVS